MALELVLGFGGAWVVALDERCRLPALDEEFVEKVEYDREEDCWLLLVPRALVSTESAVEWSRA